MGDIMSEEKLVPKLRFNGFNDGWESTKIGEIAEIVGGGTPKTEVGEYWNGEIKWFTPSEIGKTKYVKDSERHITEEGLKNSSAKLLPANTILLSSRATVGEISIALTECSTNQGFQSLITKNNVDNDFVYYLISTIKNEFIRRASGSTFLEISKNEIKRIPIIIPTLSEQKKISNLFSAIDNKIELLQTKHQYYQDFKNYLMQQIFAQKLRFANEDDWETVTINDLFENITDYVAAGSFADIKKNVEYKSEPNYAQLVRTVDLKSNFQNKDFVYVNQHAFEYLWRVNLNEPSIVLPNIGNVGEVYYINPDKLPFNNNVLAPNAILLKSKENIKFKYYLLESKYFKYQLDIINESAGRGKFNKTNLKKIKIKIPSNDYEKDKIAEFLTNIDFKIEYCKNEIIVNTNFKKGLLQQMFI